MLLTQPNTPHLLSQMVEAMKSGKYPFVMCNLAPPDMVGHTGVYDATVVACEATGEGQGAWQCEGWGVSLLNTLSVPLLADKAISAILQGCEQSGYTLLVTADHGNAETMIDSSGQPVTKHTTNKGRRGLPEGDGHTLGANVLVVCSGAVCSPAPLSCPLSAFLHVRRDSQL